MLRDRCHTTVTGIEIDVLRSINVYHAPLAFSRSRRSFMSWPVVHSRASLRWQVRRQSVMVIAIKQNRKCFPRERVGSYKLESAPGVGSRTTYMCLLSIGRTRCGPAHARLLQIGALREGPCVPGPRRCIHTYSTSTNYVSTMCKFPLR